MTRELTANRQRPRIWEQVAQTAWFSKPRVAGSSPARGPTSRDHRPVPFAEAQAAHHTPCAVLGARIQCPGDRRLGPPIVRRGKAGQMQGCFGGRAPHNHQGGHGPILCPAWRALSFSSGPSGYSPARPAGREQASGHTAWTAGQVAFGRYVTYNRIEPSEWLRQGCGKALLRVR
jgi:hypothetical protein